MSTSTKKAKLQITATLLTFLCLCFVFDAQGQTKYGVIAYQYVKASDGNRYVNYSVVRCTYNTEAEAKAEVNIWTKAGEKVDGDIVYDVISQDVAADKATKTKYACTSTAKVRDSDGKERVIEEIKYCIYNSIPDVEEACLGAKFLSEKFTEPVIFKISSCKN